jgi:hypothetical protein
MFFWRGDDNPRSNLPGRPALDPFLALLFFLGLARAFAGVRRPAWALPLLWLGVMSLPTVVTEHAPHFGRAIGGTPAVALLCALGGWTLWRGVARLGSSGLRWAGGLLLVAGLLFSGLSTGWAYFHTWASSPTLFYAYDVGLTRVAQYANALPTDQDVYLTPTSCDHYTLQFLLRRPCASFDGRVGQVFPPPDRAATVVVLLREDGATLPTLRKERPDGEVAWTLVDSYGNPYAAAYYLLASRSPAPLPTHPMDARFGGAIRLLGYATDVDAVAPGEPFTLVLYWQALAPLVEDYTVFTHLVGPSGAAGGAVLWAGHDGQPDGGHYPTRGWQPGETILDKHTLSVPEEAPLGDYRLEVGLYLLATLQRLPAVDGDGLPLPGDAAVLGNVKVRGPGSE